MKSKTQTEKTQTGKIFFSITAIVLMVLSTAGFAFADEPTTSDTNARLTTYLKLDGSGYDSITQSYPQAETGMSYTSDGMVGQATRASRSGSLIQYACEDRVSYHTGTVSAWVKFDQFSRQDQVIWHTDDSEIVLGYDDGSATGYKRIYFRRSYPQPEPSLYIQADADAPNKWNRGEWHFVAATWLGAPEGTAKLYIDGKFVQSEQYNEPDRSCSTFRVGNNYWPGQNFEDGVIDEVKVYNYALSASQIQYEYEHYDIPEPMPEPVPGALPDLIIGSISAPAANAVRVIVHNIGTAAPSKPVQAKLTDSSGREYDLARDRIGIASIVPTGGFGPGQSRWFYAQNIPAGKYSFTAEVDPGNIIAESNEANNVKSRVNVVVHDKTVEPKPGPNMPTLYITPASNRVDDGKKADYQITLIDHTKEKIGYVSYDLSVHNLPFPYTLSESTITMRPGESRKVSLVVDTGSATVEGASGEAVPEVAQDVAEGAAAEAGSGIQVVAVAPTASEQASSGVVSGSAVVDVDTAFQATQTSLIDTLDEGTAKKYTLGRKTYEVSLDYVGKTGVKFSINGKMSELMNIKDAHKVSDVKLTVVDYSDATSRSTFQLTQATAGSQASAESVVSSPAATSVVQEEEAASTASVGGGSGGAGSGGSLIKPLPASRSYSFTLMVRQQNNPGIAATAAAHLLIGTQPRGEGGVDISLQPGWQDIPFGGSSKYELVIHDKHPVSKALYTYDISVSWASGPGTNVEFKHDTRVSLGGGSKLSVPIVVYSEDEESAEPYTLAFGVRVMQSNDPGTYDDTRGSLRVGGQVIITPPSMPDGPDGDEFTLELEKGWNLVSFPGKIVKFNPGECTSGRKPVAFVFLEDGQRYVTINEARKILGNAFNSYLSLHSFWIYNFDGQCRLSVELVGKTSIEYLNIVKGWNLLPVTYDMVGKDIDEMNPADCDVQRAYLWQAGSQSWKRLSLDDTIQARHVGTGLLLKSGESCSLGHEGPTPVAIDM